MFFDYQFKNYNYRLILYILTLNILGVLVINSATGQNSAEVNKQIMGIAIGLVIAIIFSLWDYHRVISYADLYWLCAGTACRVVFR